MNRRIDYDRREASFVHRILFLRLNPPWHAMNTRVYRYTIQTELASTLLENWVNSCASTIRTPIFLFYPASPPCCSSLFIFFALFSSSSGIKMQVLKNDYYAGIASRLNDPKLTSLILK